MALSKRYLWREQVDELLAQEDVTKNVTAADRVLWPIVDHLGMVRDLVKQDGTVATHFVYDAFGGIVSGDTSLTRYLFTSREFDVDTGLQYNRARWYDASTGRWISEDPLGFAAGDVNTARYVGNGVVQRLDSNGLDWFDFNHDGSYNWFEFGVGVADGWFRGVGHGLAMIGNAATFHQIDSLDEYVDDLIQKHGGAYQAANMSAHIGVGAAYAAGGVWAWEAAGGGVFAVQVGPGEGLFGLHITYGFGTAGSYTAAHGIGTGWFTTTAFATLGDGYVMVTGIPILFPGAIGAWVARQPEVGNCIVSCGAAFVKGVLGR